MGNKYNQEWIRRDHTFDRFSVFLLSNLLAKLGVPRYIPHNNIHCSHIDMKIGALHNKHRKIVP